MTIIHIYQQLNLKNKIKKQGDRNIITDTENVLMVAKQGVWGDE